MSEKFDELTVELSKKYGKNKVIFYESDISDLNQLKAAFGFAREKLNNVRIVLNNAAILAESIWEKMIDINVVRLNIFCYN